MSHHGNAPRRAGMAAFSPAFASSAQSTGSTSHTSSATLVSILSEGVLQAGFDVCVFEPGPYMTGKAEPSSRTAGDDVFGLDRADISGPILNGEGQITKCVIRFGGRRIDLVNGSAQEFEMIHKPGAPVLEAASGDHLKRMRFSWRNLQLDNYIRDGAVVIGGVWNGSRFTPKESNCGRELDLTKFPAWFKEELNSMVKAIKQPKTVTDKAKESIKPTFESQAGVDEVDGQPMETSDQKEPQLDPRYLWQFDIVEGRSALPSTFRREAGASMAVLIDQEKSKKDETYVKVAVFDKMKVEEENMCPLLCHPLSDWAEVLKKVPCEKL